MSRPESVVRQSGGQGGRGTGGGGTGGVSTRAGGQQRRAGDEDNRALAVPGAVETMGERPAMVPVPVVQVAPNRDAALVFRWSRPYVQVVYIETIKMLMSAPILTTTLRVRSCFAWRF